MITYTLKNIILGQLKIGEHQAKCRALAPTISATYVGKYATVSVKTV